MASQSIFIENLHSSASSEFVRELFEPFGKVNQVFLINGKGFAFVEMPRDEALAAVKALHLSTVNSRIIYVHITIPVEERKAIGGDELDGSNFGDGNTRNW